MSDPDPRLIKWLNVFASASATFAIVVGLTGLAGWKLQIAWLDTWGAPPIRIAPNAAAGCFFLGIALWLLREPRSHSFASTRTVVAKTAAGTVCLTGLLVLAEHIFGWDVGIDQLLIVVPFGERIPGLRPGLVSSSAACDLILLGLAVLLLDWKTRRENWPAQYLASGGAIVAVFGFFALLLPPTRVSALTMALPAAVTFLLLACGVLSARPTWAVGGLLASSSAGATLLRRSLPYALLLLGLTCWSISKSLLTEAHFTWVEASLLAILCGATLVGSITWIAFVFDRSDTLNARLEQHAAERTIALKASEARLAGIIQSAMDAVITVDEAQSIVLFNATAEKMFRCPAAEALGKPITRFIPQRFRSAHAKHIQEFGDTGVTNRALGIKDAVRAMRFDGEEFPAEASISKVETSGRRLFTVILRDVTERKRVEEALRESEHRYRTLFNEMVVGFALLDVIYSENGTPCDHRFVEVNAAFDIQSGLSREKVLGKTICEILPGIDPSWIENYGKVATTGESIHFENYAQPIGRWLEVTAFRTNQGQVGVTFADITARKLAEEALSKKADELVRSNQDLEQFAYVASHDLQEPLRMVANYTQLLAERYRGHLDKQADKYIDYAVGGAVRMQGLIQDLLRFSRAGTQEIEVRPTDLRELVQQVLKNLEAALQESHAVVHWNGLPVVMADASQLALVFQNLVANAIKFRGAERPAVEINAVRNDQEWVLTVSDNGIGIPEENWEDIFVIFRRLHTHAEYPGNGIGLSISKKIIERHGGKIWIEAQAGPGSCFRLTLPAEPPSQPHQGVQA